MDKVYMTLNIEHKIKELVGICYSIYGVADMLGISYCSAWKLVKTKKLKSIYSSEERRYWIPSEYFADFLAKNRSYYIKWQTRSIEIEKLRWEERKQKA